MRIALPLAQGKLAMHFGHCEQFALIDVEENDPEGLSKELIDPPEHEPGVLPRWLAEQGADVIIAGGMGGRAQNLFAEHGIRVVVGAPNDAPETIVKAFLAGTLKTGGNICDH